jgi:heme exporter protein C
MLLKLHFAAGWALVLGFLGLICLWPEIPLEEKTQGSAYLIFFFHLPSAIGCLLFFLGAGVASLAYLATRSPLADRTARAAVEVGVLACTVAMVTGAIWAKAAWGAFWVWRDPRLLFVAITWFTYVGYLALRSAVESPEQRARFAAVFGILALVNLPLVHFAVNWFGRAMHPPKLEFDLKIQEPMRIARICGIVAFLVLYAAFWRYRLRVAALQERASRIEETVVLRGM